MEISTCGIHGEIPVIDGNCGYCTIVTLRQELTQAREELDYLKSPEGRSAERLCASLKEIRKVAELEGKLTQATEEVEILRTIALGWENANQTLRDRAEDANEDLYLEKTKNNSDKARVEFLEGKLDRYREALEHYAEEKLYFPRSIIRLCTEKGIRVAPIYADFGEVAQQALIDTESEKGGA